MPQDKRHTAGQPKQLGPNAGKAVARLAPVLGIVKSNIDPAKAGRIWVSLLDNSASPDDSSNWVKMSYLSPFFGKTQSTSNDTNHGDYVANPSSYGMWNSPPDVGTTVLCVMVDGQADYGYYIGCVPEPEALYMVPAIAAAGQVTLNEEESSRYGGADRLPVTNINTNNPSIADTPNYAEQARPIHSYVASVMFQQGVLRDPVRGPISSSAQRESPSRVGWGVSTPGRPIYDGGFTDENIASNLDSSKKDQLKVVSRRGGHSVVMDDGDLRGQDDLIRIRTARGHQIMMNDSGQTFSIMHSNGETYIELGAGGTVDVYSTNSVNIRTHGDLNLHADNNINIHAKKDLNIQAENMHFVSEKGFQQRVGEDHTLSVFGKQTTKVNGPYAVATSGEASIKSGANAYINGTNVNLNSGESSLEPAEVYPIMLTMHTDTLLGEKGYQAAPAALGSITSRVPAHMPWACAGLGATVPKVDLGAEANFPAAPSAAVAATNLAAAAIESPAVSQSVMAGLPSTNPTAALGQVTQAAVATVATVAASTATGAAAIAQGAAIENKATGALVASGLNTAAPPAPPTAPTAPATPVAPAGPTDAPFSSVSVPLDVSTNYPIEVKIGQYAMTPTMLEQTGYTKPGSAPLIDGLIQRGLTPAVALSPAVWTGKDGITSVDDFLNNQTIQVKGITNLLDQTGKQLTSMNLTSGKEAPEQVAGIIAAGATAGVQQVANVISGAANQVNGAIGAVTGAVGQVTGAVGAVTGAIDQAAGQVTGALNTANKVLGTIASGNLAANLAQSAQNALGGLKQSVAQMIKLPDLSALIDKAKGAAASAFGAITAGWKKLKAHVPQDLRAINKAQTDVLDAAANEIGFGGAAATGVTGAFANAAAGFGSAAAGAVGSVTGAVNSATGAVAGAVNSATGAVNSVTGAVNSATGAVNSATSAVSGAATAVSSSFANAANATGFGTAVQGLEDVTITADRIATTSGLAQSAANIGNSLVSAATNIVGQTLASATSIVSSGLSVIPGGAQVASIATNALTAGLSKIPGTDGIADMIKKAQTAAMNGLPSPAALLDAAKDGLAKLASIGLPAGAAAQLTAFMQGLGSSARVKLPAIAITSGNARDAVDGTVSTVLVDKRIPAPQFKVTSSPPTSLEVLGESSRLGRAYMDAITASGKAMNKYTKTLQNFPQGSPEVEAAWAAIQAAKAAKDAAALALQDYNAAHGVMT